MRIRSIKPEFWRSADTADLDMFTRLLFIGLWNFVDDNGVGEDDVHLIRSDLFPRDRNVDELSAQIHGSLTELSNRGQITRYKDLKTGRNYFHVGAWHHQRINRPTESKKPLPTSENCAVHDGSLNPHGVVTEDSAPRARVRDQGSEGWDQGSEGPPSPPCDEPPPERALATRTTGVEKARDRFALIPSAPSVAAREVAHAYNRSLSVPLQAKVLGEVAAEIDSCLRDHIPPEAIAAGIDEWTTSDSWSPSQIPKFVHKAANRNGRPRGVGKPTESALDYQAAAEQLLAKVSTK